MHRRTMLRGMVGGSAVALALPALEAMLGSHGDAYADGSALPRRLVTWFFGNGVALVDTNNAGAGLRFAPAGQGGDYTLTPQLAPLLNVRPYCSVLSGFDIAAASAHRRGHHDGVAGFFSGYPFIAQDPMGAPYASKFGGPSIDQVAAERIGSETVIPSVQLAVSKRIVGSEGPTLQFLSHKGPEQPLTQIFSPLQAWDRIFGSFTAPEDPTRPLRLSALDAVAEDAKRLRKRVGRADAQRLDAHLDGVAQLRREIDALAPACDLPAMPTEQNEDVDGQEQLEAVNAVMSDLLALAFACDLTRIASVQFTGSVGGTVFSSIGLSKGHHDLTHERGDNEAVDQATIFTMQRFADFLEALMNTVEGDGNLLDNSCVLLGSDSSDGATHGVFDQPCIVAGGGGGALKHPGVHYRSPSRENTSDILLACLRTVCPDATSAGGDLGLSTTPCSAILA